MKYKEIYEFITREADKRGIKIRFRNVVCIDRLLYNIVIYVGDYRYSIRNMGSLEDLKKAIIKVLDKNLDEN